MLSEGLGARCAIRRKEREAELLREKVKRAEQEKQSLKRLIASMNRKVEKHKAMAAEQMADRMRRSITEAEDMDKDDIRLILALDKEGIGLREIAVKFETDVLTVAYIVEVMG